MKKYRVVHCGTGYIGKLALRLMQQQPHLQLVGHHVHSPEKAGKDTGEFIDGKPTGVITTSNWDDVVKLKADVLTYFFDSVRREREAVEDVIRFLEAGTNVLCISGWALGHRKAMEPDLLKKLEAACQKGNSSCYFNGSDPGWATTELTIAALGGANRVESVRMIEFASFARYTAEYASREYFGFGQPPGYQTVMLKDNMIEQMWSPTLHRIAEVLDVEIDEFRSVYETETTDHDIQTGFGLVKAGTNAVIHFELQGLKKGRPFVILEHIDHVYPDITHVKQWSKPGSPEASYRIEITGSPSYALELHSHSSDINVTPFFNCIPAVVGARPGLLSPLDVPHYYSRNVAAKLGPWP